jgi:hypothetical protein
LVLCPIIALISCSKDAPTKEINDGNGEYLVKLRINIPTATTKANPGNEFSNGENYEYSVDYENSYLVFYSAEKMELVKYKLSEDNTTWEDITTDNNVTRMGTVKFKSNLKPKYVLCLLNHPEILNDYSCDGLKKFITKPNDGTVVLNNYGLKENIQSYFAPHGLLVQGNTGFYMTNSTYYTTESGNNKIIQEIELNDNQVAEVTENNEPDPTPIDIYVERVVAKVSVDDNITIKKLQNGDKEIDIEIISWSLNATNRSFAQLKNINPSTNDFELFSPGSPIDWNSIDKHRSYWAIDNNYNSVDNNHYPTNSNFNGRVLTDDENYYLNYYSLNQTTNPLVIDDNGFNPNHEYCFENTVAYDDKLDKRMNAITHIIVKARYDTGEDSGPIAPPTPPENPEPDIQPTPEEEGFVLCTYGDVFRLDGNKIIYSYTEFLDLVYDKINKLVESSGITISKENIEIKRNTNEFRDRTDVKPIISYAGEDLGEYNSRKGNLNELLFPGTQLWVFPQGYCYYVIPIYQYKTTTYANDLPVEKPYYGVVRNHWYVVKLNSIIDFGEPADPEKPIIPEPNDEKLYKIESHIKVLSWSVIEQSADLDR